MKTINSHAKCSTQCKSQYFELKYFYWKSCWCHRPFDGTGAQTLEEVSHSLFQIGLDMLIPLPLKGMWNMKQAPSLCAWERNLHGQWRQHFPLLVLNQRTENITHCLILLVPYMREKWVWGRNYFTIHLTLLRGRTSTPCWGLKSPTGWEVVDPYQGNKATQDWSKYNPLHRTGEAFR